jgi:hypothetical protein
MDIGVLITKRLEEGGFKQSAIAAQFVERAKARGVERTAATAESHLSRLKSNDRTAAQFFFADPGAANDLMDIMKFADGERAAVVDAAMLVLAPEERPVRLVVDFTTGPQDQAFVAACEQVERALLDGAVPRIALVVTDAQHHYLLRKYEDDSRLAVEQVRDATAGKEKARELAGTAGVVASTWCFPDLSRWIAIRWSGQSGATFATDPADALDALRAGRSLPAEASGEDWRDLASLGLDVKAAPPAKQWCPDALAMRQLIVSLMRGTAVKRGPTPTTEERLSWALHFGVRAAAKPEEWVEHLVRQAQKAGATVVVRAPLVEQITLAERGAKTPRVVVDRGQVYVINPAPSSVTSLEGLPGLQVREVVARVSALARLRAELSKTSTQGLLDDPHLGGLVNTLAEEGFDRAELSFVAACLLANEATGVDDAPRMRGWIEPLRAILAGDPPAAGIRVPRGIRDPHSKGFERVVLRGAAPQSTLREHPWDDPRVLAAGTVAAADVRVIRKEVLLIGQRSSEGSQMLLPRKESFDELALYEEFKRWNKTPALFGDRWAVAPRSFDEAFWCDADKLLAVNWLALRRAARRAEATTLHDGLGILEVGSGLVAEVAAYEVPSCARGGASQAELFLPLFEDARRGDDDSPAASLLREIKVRSAETRGYVTWTLARVPHAIYLAQERVRIIVRFRATSWDLFETHDGGSQLVGAAAGVVKRNDDD